MIEQTQTTLHNLIQLQLNEDLLNKILNECETYRQKSKWTTEEMKHFENLCFQLSQASPFDFSQLLNIQIDFLFWYEVQNLFHTYLSNLQFVEDDGTQNVKYVLRALKQMIAKSIQLEFFSLTDCLMQLANLNYQKSERTNWRVLAEIFAVFDELQENLVEQKCSLRFIDNIEICLNLPLFCVSQTIGEVLLIITNNFLKCLNWLLARKESLEHLRLDQELCKQFNVTEVNSDLIEFIFCGFKTLLRDRSFGYTYCPNNFVEKVAPSQTIQNLVRIVKNEGTVFTVDVVMHCLQILDGLTCVDLVKEFKNIGEKRNPYFKEACKHFSTYSSILKALAAASISTQDIYQMEVDQHPLATQSHLQSQRFMFQFLLFIQDLIELKTREMQNQLFVQIVEPLVHIIAIIPRDGVYQADLMCQESALLILKAITKRSHIFEDSELLEKIINRLKVELKILEEDLTGQPSRWRPDKPKNDLEFNSCTLERRQKFIKDCLSFLCYSIIRMDPTQVNQQQNFISHSRKILESNLFEDCLKQMVFVQNVRPPHQHFEKVIDPIFLECVQLYTFIGNDLPQKLGELIESGLYVTILQSLDKRIPIQPNLLPVMIKFFKMLNLNAKGTEAILECQALERFFELCLDHRSYKMFVMPRGSNQMFDQRQLVHSLANENQQISDRIYVQCIKNLEICHNGSWQLYNQFIQMEKDIAGMETESEKAPFRDPYGKKQINYEQTLESTVALLSCFCMDELEYLENISTHNSFVINTIRKQDISQTIFKLLRTPIICSAADGFIYHFQESATLILMLQKGLEGFQSYLDTLAQFLHQSFSDLYQVLGSTDLNTVNVIDAVKFVDLAEPSANQVQKESLKDLKSEDVAWVAINKIHMLIEMVIILGTLSKFHERLDLLPMYNSFVDKFLTAEIGGYSCIFKLQSLLHRYYANVYVESVQAQESRRNTVLPKHSEQLKQFIWASFKESDEPYSELEDARNIYYRYELQTVDSLLDKKAEDLTRFPFEFVLPETKGVIQTFKCYKKIKNLMSQLQSVYNKRRYHFKDQMLPHGVAFNQMTANFIADQLRLIASKCTSTQFDVNQSLTTALLIDRVLPELSRQISLKWKNQLNGIMLFSLLNEERVVLVVGSILEWAILQYVKLEEVEGKKTLFHARNLQIIIRECVQFFGNLLKVNYLCNTNAHTYLAYFKRDRLQAQSEVESKALFAKCFGLTKNLLYKCVLWPVSNLLFSPDRVCAKNWPYFTGGISDNVVKIYSTLCSGAFKEPFDFFAESNIQDYIRAEGQVNHRQNRRRLLDEQENGQNINTDLLNQLVSMGFAEAQSRQALRRYANDFEFSLDALIRGEFANQPVEPSEQQNQMNVVVQKEQQSLQADQQQVQILDLREALSYEQEFSESTETETIQNICHLIDSTLITCVSHSFPKAPINQKRGFINKIFQFYKDSQANQERKVILERLLINLSSKMIQIQNEGPPDWFYICFTIQLLSYAKEDFVAQMNLSKVFLGIVERFNTNVVEIGQWARQKVKSADFIKSSTQDQAKTAEEQKEEKFIENCSKNLYNIHVLLSLLFFLLTDFSAQQELQTIKTLLQMDQDINQDKSAFDETITFQDIEDIKNDVLLDKESTTSKQPVSLVCDERQKSEICKKTYNALMKLLQNFSNVEYSLVTHLKRPIQYMLGPAVKVLKLISTISFPDFDFRQAFLKDNGVRILFEMNILDSEWQAKKAFWESNNNIEHDLREIMENVWNTPRELQKWYETLIQRQLFFQFKANFKRLNQEGKLQKDPYDYILSGIENTPMTTNNQQGKVQEPLLCEQEQVAGAQTKQKSKAQSTPQIMKKSKSQQRQQPTTTSKPQDIQMHQLDTEGVFGNPSPKDLKRLVKKYEVLNEQNFSEFVKYYNSNIFGHVIVHVGVFVAACAKVCVIKKVLKPSHPTDEECKDQQYELKISIKKQLLKEMLLDPNFNYGLAQKSSQMKPPQKFDIPKCQSDLVHQLLELFIFQTKGYRMEILKYLREPQISEDQNSLLIIKGDKLCIKPDAKQERRIYFFDQVNILRALTSMITRNQSVVGVIHKHNDSKTIKFIFRNLFYLISIHVECAKNNSQPQSQDLINEVQLTSILSIERHLSVIHFLIQSLLVNFASSNSEKIIKKELQAIFVRQLSKTLVFKPYNESAWAKSSALMQKFSAIWLIAKFLTMRSQEQDTKDALAAINQKKTKFLRLQRTHMVKQIIIQCNLSQNQVFTDQGNFVLLESIQNAILDLETPNIFLFGQKKAHCLAVCVSVITKILRLFENSQSLGKFFKQLGPKPAEYNSSMSERSDVNMSMESSEEYQSDSMDDDGEDEEDDDDDDFPSSSGQNSRNLLIDELLQDQDDEMDESAEYGEEEGSWDVDESAEDENVEMNCNLDGEFEITNNADSQAAANKAAGNNDHSESGEEGNLRRSASSLSGGSEDDEVSEDEDEENSWNYPEHDRDIEQVSFQSEAESDANEDFGYEYSEMDEESLNSQDESLYQGNESDVEMTVNVDQPVRVNRIDRRSFILSQQHGSSQRTQMNIIPAEFQVALQTSQDHFNLDENVSRGSLSNMQQHITRIIQENAGILSNSINDSYLQIISGGQSKDFASFISAISQRKSQIQQLKDKVKIAEGLYKIHITTFIAPVVANNNATVINAIQNDGQPENNSLVKITASATAESSDMHVHNPNDFKGHIRQANQRQLPQQPSNLNVNQRRPYNLRQANNPLDIEGMDPLFMESLSAIGLQNIADSHQIHAQLTAQSQQPLALGAAFEVMQDLVQYLRYQPQQRRQDILRQIQNDLCRDLPQDIFTEARELYRTNRDEFMRLINNQAQNVINAQRLQDSTRQAQDTRISQRIQQGLLNIDQDVAPRTRLISIDSVSQSLDLHGPAENSQNVINQLQNVAEQKQPVELMMIRGDQFVQNFFLILQDINFRYDREQVVMSVDRQSEAIIQNALIPSVNDNSQIQFQKIKGIVQIAQIAFMNLNLESDQHQQLMQSIKILHRIPNIRICLIMSVLAQSQIELIKARQHCLQQMDLKTFLPYESSLPYNDSGQNEGTLPFVNIILGALKTTAQLQSTIETSNVESSSKDLLEVVQTIQSDQLISKFAAIIGVQGTSKSIFESLLDLILEFWILYQEHPWVIGESQPNIEIEIQNHVIENICILISTVMKEQKDKAGNGKIDNLLENKVDLSLSKLCQVFFNRAIPLSKKSLPQVSQALNQFTDTDSVNAICEFMQQKLKILLTTTMEDLSEKLHDANQLTYSVPLTKQIEQIIELFKVTSGVSKLKTRNICEELLLVQVFKHAGKIIKEEEERSDRVSLKEGKKSLFVFREEVKDLLLLLFSLCEYNLRIIFEKKIENKLEPQVVQPISQQIQIQSLDESVLLTQNVQSEQQVFTSLLQQNLSQTSPDFLRFETTLKFFMDHRRLINTYIQHNSSIVNKELIQVAFMIPQVLDFDTKRVIWKIELKRQQQKYKDEKFSFQVRRDFTLQDSFAMLNGLSAKQWRGGMQVEFVGEDGIDGGGLFKEWLSNLSKEIFNEDMALFIKAASGSTYYPNPQSTVQPNYIEMFTFVGKVFGKALWDLQLMDCYFVKAFYKIILGMPLNYSDLEDYDDSLFKSLNWMIQNTGVESICSSFVETMPFFGEQKEVELCDGGKDKIVTDENKFEYVQMVANFRLYKAISTQLDAFLKGLYSVIPKDLLKIFDNRELELLISGLQTIDIDDLRENTLYQNYTAQSKPVIYLFECLQEFDNFERAEFIRFVTGSSKVPVEGFKGLRGSNGIQKFTIVKIPGSTQTRLPQSHTCHNQLDLPEYKDKETTKRQLLMAIKEGKTFGFA